ncbi:Lipid II flippase FtsW [Methylacidimicrobium cyclopophantes]|uniref:Probable peptidoglycan glycosyltransferase FtsW n=1 Tax=Methylacidimicrobium cyclopophantes TaxID=1041766 RepID=A0A5E6MBS1_9BACT|nr:putative peptidoglycan glycosyltransferase FtsW [Methylacidimicrobium cyclopophantes]VVM05760.1 Lipid II flippase FtsW [Methylacidimicrobium cyclopophantes]
MRERELHRWVGYVLTLTAFALMGLGLIALYSAAGRFVGEKDTSLLPLVERQLCWIGVGIGGGLLLARVDYHWLLKRSWILVGVGLLLLLLCFVPGIGHKVHGSARWISLGPLTLQPSELIKWVLCIFAADQLGRPTGRRWERWRRYLTVLLVISGFAGLLLLARDLGSAALYMTLAMVVLVIAGVSLWLIVPGFLTVAGGLLGVALSIPERRARLLAFWNMDGDKQGKAYQVWQALVALGSGGVTGLGLGNSRQKMYYLPEATTDFIFPILGEELGLWVTLGVVLVYLVLSLCGGWIALLAADGEGLLLGMGLITLIAVQAIANLGVVTGLLPNKGLPLPFISYGGSNLLFCLMALGTLLNIHRQGGRGSAFAVESQGAQRSVRL